MTLQALCILNTMLQNPDDKNFALGISKQINKRVGSTMRVLRQLENQGILISENEQIDCKVAMRGPS